MYASINCPTTKENIVLEFVVMKIFIFSMVLNKKDKLAYKSHKLLMITFHIFYQLLLGLDNICTYSLFPIL